MPELYLLRHAHAGDPEGWHGPDAERPLSGKGRDQVARTATWLAGLKFEPDAIVSSPKVRAQETAELATDSLPGAPGVRLDDRLASGFDVDDLEELLEEVMGSLGDLDRPARIMLVGHDPDFSELLCDLVGSPALSMRKGALARIDVPDEPGTIRRGSGELRWLVPPDALPG